MVVEVEAEALVEAAERDLLAQFQRADRIALANQMRVLGAFHAHRLCDEHFAEATGYGLDDAGRETIDKIFASVFQAESAAARMQIVSGTHALALSMLGNLRAGERMVCVTGEIYDTLEKVVGLKGDEPGSLKDLGIGYAQIDVARSLGDPGALRGMLRDLLQEPTKMAYIQKSCGYSFDRRTYSNEEIGRICAAIKEVNPHCTVLVDNCYGEFVEDVEPCALGADLIAGSLIKNPGGGLAMSGGYIAGKRELVDRALNRLTAPGVGGHLGVTFNQNRRVLQGLFMAPSVVAQAVKGAMLFAAVFKRLGFSVKPEPDAARFDIIQAIKLGSAERLLTFCRLLQAHSPVNAHVLPEPADMPGYTDKVVMAGGTFVEGSTIELSADGPLRPPFAVFLQGGLSYLHVKGSLIGLLRLAKSGSADIFAL